MTLAASGVLDLSDTIVAQATVPGRGALAIVRVSGPRAHDIVRPAVSRWPDEARRAVVTRLHDGDGQPLDESLLIRYDAPASFTGEHAVELITHGGTVVPTTVVAALLARGARLAQPGEFTRRAVLNGKLDLLQAEAAGDLVSASSRAAQHVALRQLDGGLTRRIASLRDALIHVEALIAYDIDFPEEDEGPVPTERVLAATDAAIQALEALVATSHTGELVREGALVVLAGTPNVGKSSLFNAILGESRAIVTDIPGTTRDAIEAVVDSPSMPLRFVDTAGLRDALDPVERLGVEVSASYVSRAALVLACADSIESLNDVLDQVAQRTRAPVIAVRTKSDIAPADASELRALERGGRVVGARAVSAETGDGVAELLTLVEQTLAGETHDLDAPLLTHTRHRLAVSRALDEARAFRAAWHDGGLPAPVAAVHLRTAITALQDLIGAVDVEEILDEVFRRFCVGK